MTDSPSTLADAVKARAAELGFDLVGIASAEPFDADLQRTLAWIEDGLHGTMRWITPERTRGPAIPTSLLPGARSIVVVGASYARPGASAPGSEAAGSGRSVRAGRRLP